jgi:crotonobetainyl-CoA:carnitine CoA-transferase CaiB-like acyl-CoA transferase
LDSPELRAISGLDLYTHRDQYALTLESVLRERRFEDVSLALDKHDIWFARVMTYADLRADPQLQHNRVFRKIHVGDDEVVLVNHPIRYDGEVPPLRHIALRPGQDTRQILEELGYTRDAVDELLESASVVSSEARTWTQEHL